MDAAPHPVDHDTELLHKLGYAQELWRRMGGFANFAVSFSIISILTGGISSYDLGLAAAGPAEMGIGWPIVCFFSLMVAMAMAEIASAFPTAGGLYHWASILGGVGWGWLTAWLNLMGLVTVLAAIDFGFVEFVLGWAGVRSNLLLKVAVTVLVLVTQGIVNHRGIRITAILTDVSVWVNMAGAVGITVSLLALARHHPVSWLFTIVNKTGAVADKGFPQTSSDPWALVLGFLLAAYTITGYDASAHTAEETVDAPTRVPWGIVMSVAVSAVFGYLMIASITLAITDLDKTLAAERSVIYVMEQSLPGWLHSSLLATIALAQYFCGLATVTSLSRMIYAFARDGGLPGSRLWRRVSHRYRTPAHAIWLGVALASLFTTLSPVYSTITCVATISLYVSYALPSFLGVFARDNTWTKPGPWSLGRWFKPVALVATAWVAFICVIFVQPPNHLALWTMLCFLAFLAVYWVALAKRQFQGPPRGVMTAERQRAIEALEAELATAD
jgi:amino acid transporter